MKLQKIKERISKSVDRFLDFAEDKKKEKWVVNPQYAQIVFIVKRNIISMQVKKTMIIIVKSLVVSVYNIWTIRHELFLILYVLDVAIKSFVN